MKVEFSYGGIDVNFEMEQHEGCEVNPVPILEGILAMYQSVMFAKSLSVTMKTSKEPYQ